MKELSQKRVQNFVPMSFENEDPQEVTFETTSPEKLERERKIGRFVRRGFTALLMTCVLNSENGINKAVSESGPDPLPPLSEMANIKPKPEMILSPDTAEILLDVVNPIIEKSRTHDLFVNKSLAARRAYGMDINEKFVGIKPVEYVYNKPYENSVFPERGWDWHVGLFHLLRDGEEAPVPFVVRITSGSGEHIAYFSIPVPVEKSIQDHEPYLLGMYSEYKNSQNIYLVGINNDKFEIQGDKTFRYSLGVREEVVGEAEREFHYRKEGFQSIMEYVTHILPASQQNILVRE